MSQPSKHIIFTGRVQGVGFRFTAQRIAQRYDLVGYVKNIPNSSVEMLIQGRPKDIQACLNDIAETFAGHIRQTNIEDITPTTAYTAFNITF
ncbi:MAG: acylphosphatase [Anaerohalosphaera sp.]|nr:acylphosphatase [Anaerohalosphaera sp.]